jgi:hypothetical protein
VKGFQARRGCGFYQGNPRCSLGSIGQHSIAGDDQVLLWDPTPGMCSNSGCEDPDPKKAKVPPTDCALNARLTPFETMPGDVENALFMVLKARIDSCAQPLYRFV